MDRDGVETHFQQGAAFEVAHALGVNHSTACGRAFFNYRFSVDLHRLRNCRGKALPGAAALWN